MLKALIFDFDGLILDTETPEVQVWQSIYKENGFELPIEEWEKTIGGYGLSDFDAAEHLSILSQGRLDSVSSRARYRKESDEIIHASSILPGVTRMIEQAKENDLKIIT
jgi:beta-phosphoglucomutase-like phosphatase (HAD superfamily)